MFNLQLGVLQYGAVPIYDATTIRVLGAPDRYVDFNGAFTYSGGGGPGGGGDPYGYDYAPPGMGGAVDPNAYYPTSGSITRIVEGGPFGTTWDASGLSIDAPTLFNLLRTSPGEPVINLVFGGADVFNGSAAADWMDGFGGDDTISGGLGADSVRGFDGNDLIDGGADTDDVNGNRGQDVVHGADGADLVRGGQGDDTVFGDSGDDFHVNGNIGADLVFGGLGTDTVFGGQNDDRLFGEDGDDALSGDLGFDVLTGGAGADRFLFRAGSSIDWVADFNAAEGDRIQLAPGEAFTMTSVDGQAMVTLSTGEGIGLAGVPSAAFSTQWVVFA